MCEVISDLCAVQSSSIYSPDSLSLSGPGSLVLQPPLRAHSPGLPTMTTSSTIYLFSAYFCTCRVNCFLNHPFTQNNRNRVVFPLTLPPFNDVNSKRLSDTQELIAELSVSKAQCPVHTRIKKAVPIPTSFPALWAFVAFFLLCCSPLAMPSPFSCYFPLNAMAYFTDCLIRKS